MYWVNVESDGNGRVRNESVERSKSRPQDRQEFYRAGGHDDAPVERSNDTVFFGPYPSERAASDAIEHGLYCFQQNKEW